MSQELFQQILSDLKKCRPDDKLPHSFIGAITAPLLLDLSIAAMLHSCKCSEVIKVMESGIFHNDSTISYPIKDLALFILRASSFVFRPDMEEIFRDSISAFDRVIKLFPELKFSARSYRSKVSLTKLDRIEQKLEDIKSCLLKKPQRKLGFRLRKDLRNEPDRIDKLIKLFKEQFPPDAFEHEYRIAGAIQTLLGLVGIDATQEAIAQRMYRMKLNK